MKIESVLNSRVGGYLALGIMGVGAAVYLSKKIPTVKGAINAVSPLNNNNIFSSAVNSVGQGVTGNDAWSLGGAVYDATHTEYDPNIPGSGGFDWQGMALAVNPAAWAGAKVAKQFDTYVTPTLNFDYVNPASDKNLINQGVEKLGQTVTGNKGWSLGGWIYDVFHPGQ